MSKLYAVLLGGSGGPGRLSEDHETVFVVAEDLAGAKRQAKAKWQGHGRGHVDAITLVDVVDGHKVRLEESDSEAAVDFLSYNDEPFDEEAGS
jgi:Domain of Unknown Function (DUF1543)